MKYTKAGTARAKGANLLLNKCRRRHRTCLLLRASKKQH